MFHFSLHIGDYVTATAHLTMVEDGAYNRLLRRYYQDEKPLPVDVATVQRLVGAHTDDERATVEVVLREFFTLQGDGWHNERADKEIAAYHHKARVARQNGPKGGRPPGGPKPKKNQKKTDVPTQQEPTTNRNGTNNKPTPNPPTTDTEPTGNPPTTDGITQQEPRPNPQGTVTVNRKPITDSEREPVGSLSHESVETSSSVSARAGERAQALATPHDSDPGPMPDFLRHLPRPKRVPS